MNTKLACVLFSLLLTSAAQSADLAHNWSQGRGGTSTDNLLAVAVDGLGNTYITGNFTGSVDFGGGNLANAGAYDIFLAKYDINGNHLWSQSFGSTNNDYGTSVAVDASGNVYLAGRFEADIHFGGATLINAGLADIFVAKLDANGNHIWSKGFGSNKVDYCNAIAVDSAEKWPLADACGERSTSVAAHYPTLASMIFTWPNLIPTAITCGAQAMVARHPTKAMPSPATAQTTPT